MQKYYGMICNSFLETEMDVERCVCVGTANRMPIKAAEGYLETVKERPMKTSKMRVINGGAQVEEETD